MTININSNSNLKKLSKLNPNLVGYEFLILNPNDIIYNNSIYDFGYTYNFFKILKLFIYFRSGRIEQYL